jgi:protocatechuate 3,4-dioxygenase beta subunit
VLIKIWRANAAGRHAYEADQHQPPTHFSGVGRIATNAAAAYRFVTIKPGAYP